MAAVRKIFRNFFTVFILYDPNNIIDTGIKTKESSSIADLNLIMFRYDIWYLVKILFIHV